MDFRRLVERGGCFVEGLEATVQPWLGTGTSPVGRGYLLRPTPSSR